LRVELLGVHRLTFDDGGPVRAASGIAPFGGGWLVAQDDSVDAAWWTGSSVRRLRVLDPVGGHDVFGPAAGTKHLKPDLESACAVPAVGGVLLLGSGSLPARTSAVLVQPTVSGTRVLDADVGALCAQVVEVLRLGPGQLNLEGACVLGDVLRWFQRGSSAQGVPSASVDVDLTALLAALDGSGSVHAVRVGAPRRYALGTAAGLALAVTDAVALPDGRVLVSTAAEDTADPVADGPMVASGLAVLDGGDVVATAALPALDGVPAKVEGLAVTASAQSHLDLLAVVDEDAEGVPSPVLELRLTGL